MRVVAIVNQKGGCGKTTTAINLAAVMARDGVRSLLVDMDPQSHCAAGLGVPDQRIERTIGDAMLAENPAALSVDEFVWEVGRNLHLAPSSVTLSLLEAPNGPLTARFDRDRRLARVLATDATPAVPFKFTAITAQPGQIQMTGTAGVGQTYVLEYSRDLKAWLPLATKPATAATIEFIDPNPSDEHRNYRVRNQ